MSSLPHDLDHYLDQHATDEPAILQRLSRETHLHVLHANMLSGKQQGWLLQFLSGMLRPKRILEIGTFTGYSAICLAAGLAEDGLLYTIDKNAELEDRVRKYLAEAGLEQQVRLMIGNAVEIIPTLDETFDLVFIDADKANYGRYFDLVADKIRSGGLLLADNVLWYTKVLDPERYQDKETQAIRAFNQQVHQDPRFENLILPLRDGLMMARKK